MKRFAFYSSAALMVAVLAAGCTAVERARKAQSAAEGVMIDAKAAQKVFEPVSISDPSLRNLVEYALTNRPSMVSRNIAVEEARIALKTLDADAPIVSSTPWNSVSANVKLGYSERSESRNFSNFAKKTDRSNPSSSLSIDLLIYDFGRNDALKRTAAENVIAAELELAEEGYKVFYQVASAYFTLLCNEALCDVAHSNVLQYASRLAQAKDMFEQGEVQQLDVLRAKLDLARAVENSVLASNEVVVAGANLVAYLGVNAAQGDYRSVFGGRLGGLEKRVRVFGDTSVSSAEAFAGARINAPQLKIARARLRAASSQVDYAIADLKPTVSASLSLNWTDPLWYWNWGVNAAQSLFTGWRKTLAVDRAVLEMQSRESDVEAAELLLSRNLEMALSERDNALKASATAKESILSARENLETVRAQFEVGDVSRIEFTDAVSNYADALGNEIKAFYRGQMAEAALFEIMGESPVYFDIEGEKK